MSQEVFLKKCGKCGGDVYGIFTSAFEDALTVLFECSQCGHIWSEDQPLNAEADAEKRKKASGVNEPGGEK